MLLAYGPLPYPGQPEKSGFSSSQSVMVSGPAHIPSHAYRSRLLVTMISCVVGATLLFSYVFWNGYSESMRDTEVEVQNYAELLSKRLEAALRTADADLLIVKKTIPKDALNVNNVTRYAEEWNSRFDLLLADFPELAGLRVFDAGGDLLYTNDRKNVLNANIADRPHFKATRDGETAVFSDVLVSRTTDQKMLIISRRLQDERGVFLGIVTASLDFDYFLKLFQQLKLGGEGNTSIYRKDNFKQVLRWPSVDQRLNEPLPMDNPMRIAIGEGRAAGAIHITSSADGIPRIYGYHALDNYPFFVGAGISEQEALVKWRFRSVFMALLTIALLALLVHQTFELLRSAKSSGDNLRRFSLASSAGAVGVWELDLATGKGWGSEYQAKIFGYSPQDTDWNVQRFVESVVPEDRERVRDLVGRVRAAGHADRVAFECRITRTDNAVRCIDVTGDVVLDGRGKPRRVVGTVVDITDRKQSEEQIRQLAFYDPLTRLANRRLFLDRLAQALAVSNRSGRFGAMMYMDLDNFKSLNDKSGHDAGDLLLVEVAARLRNCVREMDTVARFGGDEFVVLLIELDDDATVARSRAEVVAEKIRQTLAAPYRLRITARDGREVSIVHQCTVSLGFALFDDHEATSDQILSRADTALYQAKAAGRNSIRFWEVNS